MQKRKEFNSQAHRVVAPEQKQLARQAKTQAGRTPTKGPKAQAERPTAGGGASKWKLQSMQFRLALQAGRQAQAESNFGGGFSS